MTTYRTQPQRWLSLGRLSWVGLLTILACISVNIIVRTIAVSLFGVSASFQPLQLPPVIVSTVVYLLLAIGVLLLVSRVSEHPIRAYRIIAGAFLVISLLFPLMALTGVLPTPGMSDHIFWSMILMHVLSAAIVIILLPAAITDRKRHKLIGSD